MDIPFSIPNVKTVDAGRLQEDNSPGSDQIGMPCGLLQGPHGARCPPNRPLGQLTLYLKLQFEMPRGSDWRGTQPSEFP